MGGGFMLAGHKVTFNAAVIGMAALAVLLLLKRKASQPTVLTTSSIGGTGASAVAGSPLSGAGIISSAPSLGGAGAPPWPTSASAARTYVTGQGDTLSGIAARILGDYQLAPAIASMNRNTPMDPSNITPGTVLQLPPASPSMPNAQVVG